MLSGWKEKCVYVLVYVGPESGRDPRSLASCHCRDADSIGGMSRTPSTRRRASFRASGSLGGRGPTSAETRATDKSMRGGCIAKATYVEYVMPRLPNTSPQTLSVLELLLESPHSWHYGYALSQLTGLKSGTLYPILLRLADQGWLETRWAEPEQPGRPPRHTYRLTGQGAKAARTKLAEAAPVRMTRRLASVPGGG